MRSYVDTINSICVSYHCYTIREVFNTNSTITNFVYSKSILVDSESSVDCSIISHNYSTVRSARKRVVSISSFSYNNVRDKLSNETLSTRLRIDSSSASSYFRITIAVESRVFDIDSTVSRSFYSKNAAFVNEYSFDSSISSHYETSTICVDSTPSKEVNASTFDSKYRNFASSIDTSDSSCRVSNHCYTIREVFNANRTSSTDYINSKVILVKSEFSANSFIIMHSNRTDRSARKRVVRISRFSYNNASFNWNNETLSTRLRIDSSSASSSFWITIIIES